MSQLSGAFTVEIDTTRLADEVADRVLSRLHDAARQAAGAGASLGGLVYERESEPDPGAGARRGARFGVVTETGVAHDDEP